MTLFYKAFNTKLNMGTYQCKKCGQRQDDTNISRVHLLGDRTHCRVHSNEEYFVQDFDVTKGFYGDKNRHCKDCGSKLIISKSGDLECNSNCHHDWVWNICLC